MASLRKRPGSEKWVPCYTLPDGTRAQKSTGLSDRKKAWAICLEWETAATRARDREFTEAQARRVVDEICQRAGLGGVEFTTIEQFLNRWLDSKEVTKSVGTTTRYRHICEKFIEHLQDRKTRSLGAITPMTSPAFATLRSHSVSLLHSSLRQGFLMRFEVNRPRDKVIKRQQRSHANKSLVGWQSAMP
jgi:hypothetical protein